MQARFWRRSTVTAHSKLNGVRVLITRPEGRNEELAEALRHAGAEVVIEPLLRIVALSGSDPEYQRARRLLLDLDHYRHLIFVSTNAVDCGMALIDELWPQYPMDVQCHAVGAATAAALRQWPWPAGALNSLNDAEHGSMNSESLLAIPALQDVAHQKVLIVRGCGGREHIAQTLRDRGAIVDYAECYRRADTALGALELQARLDAQQPNVVCLNSGETLQAFCARIPASQRGNYSVLLPSVRVADIARKAGFSEIILAENAGTAATLAALSQWQRDNHVRQR